MSRDNEQWDEFLKAANRDKAKRRKRRAAAIDHRKHRFYSKNASYFDAYFDAMASGDEEATREAYRAIPSIEDDPETATIDPDDAE